MHEVPKEFPLLTDVVSDPSQECAGLGIQNQVYSPEAVQPRQDPPGSSIFHEPNSARSVGSASSTYAPSPQAPRHAMPPSPYTSQPPGFSPFGRRHGSGGQHSLLSRSPADEKLEFGHLLQQQQQQQGRHNSRGGRDLQAYGVEETPSVHSISNQPMSTLSPFENDREDCPPAYAYPPKNINQTCPLDGLLLKFLADQRQRALEGVPTGELIGPPYPSFRSLINPQASDSSHALSRVFTDMLGKFPDISTLPEQVGILCVSPFFYFAYAQEQKTDRIQIHNVHSNALANLAHTRNLRPPPRLDDPPPLPALRPAPHLGRPPPLAAHA